MSRRLALILATTLYACSYFAVYQLAIIPRYAYFGLAGRDLGGFDLALIFTLAILPSTWIPTRLERPSYLLFLTLFILVYIPALFIGFYSGLPRLTLAEARALACSLFLGLSTLSLVYRVRVARLARPAVTPTAFWGGILCFAAALFGYLVLTFGSMFRFVSLQDVGSQREAFGTIAGGFGPYAIAWLASALNPLIAAWGFHTRRRWLVAGALAGQLVLYGASAAKGYLLSIPLILLLGFAVPRFVEGFTARAITAAAAGGAAGPLISAAGLPTVGFVGTFLLTFRSLSIPGLATVQYFGFFRDHAHTLGSHIRGLSSLIQYPYGLGLDRLMAFHYYDTILSATNANLWATDAIAGFGLGAIVPVSLVCAAVFYVIDLVADGLDLRLTTVALGYGTANFSNVPLATNLLTGGIGLLIVAFYLMPRSAPVTDAA